jgi:hypothetical protein
MLFSTRSTCFAGAILFLLTSCAPDSMGADTGPSGTDSGMDAGAHATCSVAADCDDGTYCNGPERCMPSAAGADARGCVAGTMPCADAAHCSEATSACLTACDLGGDEDGDHVRSIACGGTDCDDSDPGRYPGNPEVCDTLAHDEDCDPTTYGFRDADADGVADARCCNIDAAGTSTCGTDCQDMAPTTHPTAAEVCDGMDQDCDGAVDEGVLRTFYPDADNDHYGARDGTPTMACDPPAGTVEGDHTDCNDAVATIHPSMTEQCVPPGTDENCDGATDEGCTCSGPSRSCPGALGACAAGVQMCSGTSWGACSIMPVPETCNAIDDNCDGHVDEGVGVLCYRDDDSDGLPVPGSGEVVCAATGGGCPPGTIATAPSATVFDCDDTNPAGMGTYFYCYTDADGDTYAGAGPPATAVCMIAGATCPTGTVRSATPVDCSDASAAVHPGASETCNGIDDNCDGNTDECSPALNQLRACSAGACMPTGCVNGFSDCNGMPGDGCEASFDSVTTCGSCTTVCGADEGCCNHACVTLLSAPNCGSCGRNCTGTSHCCDGRCTTLMCS